MKFDRIQMCIEMLEKNQKLTPSFVQMQLVHGDGNADWPTATCRPPIWHPDTTFSLHALKSIVGIVWHGTRGFLIK